ncbi:hypothetical protein Gotri_022460, partial [Gossypium trilobum]|nr:hypothetical protein [Gossypium trilobum]
MFFSVHLIYFREDSEYNQAFKKAHCSFASQLVYCLWGILDQLKLALDWRFERVLIQTDNLEAINIIKMGIERTPISP